MMTAASGGGSIGHVPRSVLIVDDDPRFRRLAVRLLGSWGHVVAGEAGTVGEALARARELSPDLVLADIGLPDGNGFALTHELLTFSPPPDVVLVSSDADAGNSTTASR